jgi:hypothetical protein
LQASQALVERRVQIRELDHGAVRLEEDGDHQDLLEHLERGAPGLARGHDGEPRRHAGDPRPLVHGVAGLFGARHELGQGARQVAGAHDVDVVPESVAVARDLVAALLQVRAKSSAYGSQVH